MSPIAHTALGLLGWNHFAETKSGKTLALFVIMACLPDIDFGLFLFMGTEGFGLHQYYTHNVFFVLVTALFFLPLFETKRERLGLLLVAFSHLVLDFFTIDGGAPFGFRMFYPVWEEFFNMGILPNLWKADLSEVFSLHNVWVLCFETVVFMVPALFFYRKNYGKYLKPTTNPH